MRARAHPICRCVSVVVLGFGVACAHPRATRVLVPADPLVVNTNQWTPLGVQVLDAGGHLVLARGMRMVAAPGALLDVRPNGSISCRDDGVATVVVTLDSLRASMTVRCHLVRRFGPPVVEALVAGGPPTPFVLVGYDRNGQVIQPLHIELVTGDTTVVRLRDGLVYGLKPGATGIGAKSLGHEGGMVLFVRAPESPAGSGRREPTDSAAAHVVRMPRP